MVEEVAGVFAVDMQIFRAIKLDGDSKFGYKVIGPEDQEFHLMRVHDKPHLMIALDRRRRTQPPSFKGLVFSDEENDFQIMQAR
jgi:hypothetical protein